MNIRRLKTVAWLMLTSSPSLLCNQAMGKGPMETGSHARAEIVSGAHEVRALSPALDNAGRIGETLPELRDAQLKSVAGETLLADLTLFPRETIAVSDNLSANAVAPSAPALLPVSNDASKTGGSRVGAHVRTSLEKIGSAFAGLKTNVGQFSRITGRHLSRRLAGIFDRSRSDVREEMDSSLKNIDPAWVGSANTRKGGVAMNQWNRRYMLAASLAAVAGSAHALGIADGLWDIGIGNGKAMARTASAWRPEGIKERPITVRSVDLSVVESKLGKLDDDVKMAVNAKRNGRPSVGLDLSNPNQPTLVTGMMSNVASRGVRQGDYILSVNGHPVTGFKDVSDWSAQGDVVMLTFAKSGMVTVRKQLTPTLDDSILGRVRQLAVQYREDLNQLRQRANDPRARERIEREISRLENAIDALTTMLADAQKRLYAAAYGTSAS